VLPSEKKRHLKGRNYRNDTHPMVSQNGVVPKVLIGGVNLDSNSYRFSLAKACCAVVAFVLISVWYRKRQFDRKGYHKKKESDVA
jgi:hypothetical protein